MIRYSSVTSAIRRGRRCRGYRQIISSMHWESGRRFMNNIPVEDEDFQRNYANGKYDMVYAVHCKR